MKKAAAWVLILSMLFGLLTACNGQASNPSTPSGGTSAQTSSEELDEITNKLLNDWYAYIIRCEYLYGDMQWALSYLDPFFEDHSWNSLQIARAAMSFAKLRLKAINPIEAQMTFEDYDKLIQTGADVGPVQLAVDSVPSLTDAVSLDYRVYQNSLNSPSEEFFLTYQLSYFENWVNLMRQIYDIYLHSCALETDYILLSIDNEEDEMHFIEVITKNCPQINAWRENTPQDPTALLEEMDELGNELESLVGELAAVIGQARSNLELYRDASELDADGDMNELYRYVSTIAADAVDLQDFPIALPYPNWWYVNDSETFIYVWNEDEDNDQNHLIITPGETIEMPPDQYIATWADVSFDEYQDYVKSLEKFLVSLPPTIEDQGTYTTIFKFPSAYFALTWENGEASLFSMEGSVCFAPPWYVYHTRLAS